jgi:Gpi18-like mannosyltransferase
VTGRLRAWLSSAEFADAVLLTLGIRLALLVAAPIAVILFGDDAARARIPIEIWNRWDAPHQLEVAEVGYVDPARSVVFPLLPALIRAGSFVLPPLVAGLLISIVASVVAAIALYRLARLDGADRRVTRGVVLAMNVFPTSFALVPPYTEPLFIAFAAWAFLRARHSDWLGAGVLGLLAALTRAPGVLLLPALLLELRGRRRSPRMLALGLILGGPLVYLGINTLAYGDPFFFMAIQREIFHHQMGPPWQAILPLLDAVSEPRAEAGWLMLYLAPLLSYLVLAAATIWAVFARRGRASYAAYAGLSLLLFASYSDWPISVPRYIIGAFPLFLMLGGLARSRVGPVVLVASSILLGFLATQFSLGRWAF